MDKRQTDTWQRITDSLADIISEWISTTLDYDDPDLADNVPTMGYETPTFMANAAIAVLQGMVDGQEMLVVRGDDEATQNGWPTPFEAWTAGVEHAMFNICIQNNLPVGNWPTIPQSAFRGVWDADTITHTAYDVLSEAGRLSPPEED